MSDPLKNSNVTPDLPNAVYGQWRFDDSNDYERNWDWGIECVPDERIAGDSAFILCPDNIDPAAAVVVCRTEASTDGNYARIPDDINPVDAVVVSRDLLASLVDTISKDNAVVADRNAHIRELELQSLADIGQIQDALDHIAELESNLARCEAAAAE